MELSCACVYDQEVKKNEVDFSFYSYETTYLFVFCLSSLLQSCNISAWLTMDDLQGPHITVP